ncbi:hypothetical protein N0M98_09375 [Paenibacillus doosanensis]|uniref:hypothetical protein n=1 Tax=Paenibacillus doosanensis TaxID=1229154 RepID=UPI00217FFF2F|nr:hypothetical protein [Paenibacillus doosanensis]MCS7460351.1 hypothetical protein [Paenibacillus doosanensis]
MPKTTNTKISAKATNKRPPAKKVNKLFLNVEALPEIMTVNDMKEFTGYGINQCYAHCRKNQFKVIRNGKSYFIIKDSFLSWFKGETLSEAEAELTH